MVYVCSWDDVIDVLAPEPWRTRLRLVKGMLPHPETAGLTLSAGMPEGQLADYRAILEGGAGLHVKDFGTHYEAHLDEVHPEVDTVEHLRQDAPAVYIGGAVAAGAAVGGLLGRSWKSAFAGAVLAGIAGVLLVDDAQEDDESRPRPG